MLDDLCHQQAQASVARHLTIKRPQGVIPSVLISDNLHQTSAPEGQFVGHDDEGLAVFRFVERFW